MATPARCLSALATAALLLALATARPQFGSLFGGPPVHEQPPFVPSPDDPADSAAPLRGSVSMTVTQPEPAVSPAQTIGASATLGQCPSNASRLLNEPVARMPIHGMRVATKIRYDGRGCFAERECSISCVRIDAPDKNWRPTSMSITGGGLGLSGIEVTITSPVSLGYSVRVLIYGFC